MADADSEGDPLSSPCTVARFSLTVRRSAALAR